MQNKIQNTNRGAGVGMEELLFLHPPNNSNEFDKNQFKVPIKVLSSTVFVRARRKINKFANQ